MNSINDERGCSVCQPVKENYCTYTTKVKGKRVRIYQYDYRTESGELFACCAPTLERCVEETGYKVYVTYEEALEAGIQEALKLI